tara:strand:+ start:703 stop:1119 length:417 start_codon:yes stop_codon:yes gene_type:complete
MIADQYLPFFDKVITLGKDRWKVNCCCHEEKTPSLHIQDFGDKVKMHCFGCGANGKDVCEVLGLPVMSLFGNDFKPGEHRKSTPPYADILSCLSSETLFLKFAAEAIKKGKVLCDSDMERLDLAIQRIHAAVVAGGLK